VLAFLTKGMYLCTLLTQLIGLHSFAKLLGYFCVFFVLFCFVLDFFFVFVFLFLFFVFCFCFFVLFCSVLFCHLTNNTNNVLLIFFFAPLLFANLMYFQIQIFQSFLQIFRFFVVSIHATKHN